MSGPSTGALSSTLFKGCLLYTSKPVDRQREVSFALRAYAMFATSADKGAVRDRTLLGE